MENSLQKKIQRRRRSAGFTIIEVMIAMAIFTVIVTIGIGSVLNAISQHHITADTRTVMDSMNFVMEDMARNIRLGTNVHCVTGAIDEGVFETPGDPASPIIPQSCPGGSSQIVFTDLAGRHLLYLLGYPGTPFEKKIAKSSNDAPLQSITPPEVVMDFTHSGFTVRGAEADDHGQTSVIIRLAGTITYKDYTSKFAIQTTVSLRSLDS
jgi:prepilin-type N-terminal cleavage/methylation domain-containing protein